MRLLSCSVHVFHLQHMHKFSHSKSIALMVFHSSGFAYGHLGTLSLHNPRDTIGTDTSRLCAYGGGLLGYSPSQSFGCSGCTGMVYRPCGREGDLSGSSSLQMPCCNECTGMAFHLCGCEDGLPVCSSLQSSVCNERTGMVSCQCECEGAP